MTEILQEPSLYGNPKSRGTRTSNAATVRATVPVDVEGVKHQEAMKKNIPLTVHQLVYTGPRDLAVRGCLKN